jgi:hypothetical protein
LEAGKGTNHENSGSKTLPETVESDFTIDLLNLSSGGFARRSLVEDGDHGISWMRNDGAEDTSDVTRHEGNHHLFSLGVFTLWLGENVSVEGLHNLFEGDKLDDGVWNLSAPEWGQTLVETVGSFSGFDLVETLNSTSGEGSWLRSLHSDFELYFTF